ncbi:MAG: hypothetical protein AAF322_14250 [Pseudomonadota bacterium]
MSDGDRPAQTSDAAQDDAALAAAKARDAAFVLPLAGLALLSPPVLGVFAFDARPFGAPAIVVYLFAVWAVLILGAAILSRRLARRAPGGER